MAAISLILIIQKNFQLPTPPKFGSLVFQVSTELEYQHPPLWKNWKMAAISLILIVWKNFLLLTPPKVWVSGFPSVNGNRISALAIMKKLKNGCHFFNINHTKKCPITKILKNGCHFFNIDHTEKFPITNPPPKFGPLVFLVSMETEYQYQPLWKNWKMAAFL